MESIRKNIRLLFVFVLPVYIYIVQSSIQNKHTHFYPNGIVVAHSHPVDTENDDPLKDHDHTQTEICLFQQLKIDFFTVSVEMNIKPGEFFVARKFVIVDDEKHGRKLAWQPLKRGPPIRFQLMLKTA